MNTKAIIKKLNKKAGDLCFCLFVKSMNIDLNAVNVETIKLNEEQYEMFEKACDDTTFENNFYEIFFCCDSSGYDYWNIKQEENNFIYCSIKLKKCKGINVNELYFDILRTIKRLNTQLVDISPELHYDY